MCINLQKSADSTPKSCALSIEHDESLKKLKKLLNSLSDSIGTS